MNEGLGEKIYQGGAALFGGVTFLGSWIWCIANYGFLLGVGLGWIPSMIVGFLVGLLWPLVAIGIAAIVIALWPEKQTDNKPAVQPTDFAYNRQQTQAQAPPAKDLKMIEEETSRNETLRQEALSQAQSSMRDAVILWESTTKARDPNYISRQSLILDRARALIAETPPKTGEEAVALAEQAYAEVSKGFEQRKLQEISAKSDSVAKYCITNLALGETLSVQAGPGVSYETIYNLPSVLGGVQSSGRRVMDHGTEWMEISFHISDQSRKLRRRGGGWVKSSFLRSE